MPARIRGVAQPAQAFDPGTLVHAEPNFEAVFHIPDQHQLRLVRSRCRGGACSGVTWEHEEYDASGALVAEYESYTKTDPVRGKQSAWRKFIVN